MLGDRVADEVVAGTGPIAAEGLAMAELIGGGAHGLDGGGRQRLGHVADAAMDDASGGLCVRPAERIDATTDLREQVPAGELEVMLVDEGHLV